MSLRVRNRFDHDVGLTYSFSATPDSKILTKMGAISLSVFPIAYLALAGMGIPGFEQFVERKIDVGLFTIGASLLLPNIQPDQSIRKKLVPWCT